jgi:hypothetical protein
MEFRCCSVAGMHFSTSSSSMMISMDNYSYGRPSDTHIHSMVNEDEIIMRPLKPDSQDKNVKSLQELVAIAKNPDHEMTVFVNEFLTLLAICHTVIPEGDKEHPEGKSYGLGSNLILTTKRFTHDEYCSRFQVSGFITRRKCTC